MPKSTVSISPTGRVRRPNARIFLTYDGKTLTFDEWAKIVFIHPSTLAQRKNRGWSDKKILTTPARKLKT